MSNFYIARYAGKVVGTRKTERTYTNVLVTEDGAWSWFGRPELAHAHVRKHPAAAGNVVEVEAVSSVEYSRINAELVKIRSLEVVTVEAQKVADATGRGQLVEKSYNGNVITWKFRQVELGENYESSVSSFGSKFISPAKAEHYDPSLLV